MLPSMKETINNKYNISFKNIKVLFPAITFSVTRVISQLYVTASTTIISFIYSPHLGTYSMIVVLFFPMIFTYPHLHNKPKKIIRKVTIQAGTASLSWAKAIHGMDSPILFPLKHN